MFIRSGRCRLTGLLAIVVILAVLMLLRQRPSATSGTSDSVDFRGATARRQKAYSRPNQQKPPKTAHLTPRTILLWSKFQDFSLTTGNDMFQRFKCAYNNCHITFDRKSVSTAKAVLFYLRETEKMTDLPQAHPDGQKWVFCLKEPPVYSFFDERLLDGLFDWTMTYRQDSDIVFPYGYFTKRPKTQKTLPDYYERKMNASEEFASNLAPYRKLSSIAWIVSRCQSHSKRESYVEQLQYHMAVDIYGKCGVLECSKGNATDSCQNILQYYHFYLAFENSLCPDYVTEKLFKILAVQDFPVIPVVLGGGDYSALAPPNSVVNARDFDSPADLAHYLQRILDDRVLYNSFHEWRKVYRVVPWGTPLAFCKLCEKLHKDGKVGKRKALRSYWSKESCEEGNFNQSALIL